MATAELSSFIDQSGNLLDVTSPAFLSPEWGNVLPFAMTDENLSTFTRESNTYKVYHDLGPPPYLTNSTDGKPYEPQLVARGDFTRVLAEFWADGPHSETPPGHWFTILNYVSDHKLLTKKINGEGEEVDDLEWDVKSYFVLGGAMHDVAITAWGIKGWYDYIRPISAIRYMAEQGQSTEPDAPDFHAHGIPLIEGYIERVVLGDELAGDENEHVGKIKLYTWKGHDFISDPETDEAGVGWILAENWWPYQRPSFVTPPFAGYVSGHSTYSRAAAEVLTRLTGSPFFPGGMGEFVAKKNEFLVFEEGPSQDVILQWASYRDASDQCSLSRIWGGIHPPADDINGRIIGEKIGNSAFDYAMSLFNSKMLLSVKGSSRPTSIVYPNPASENRIYVKSVQKDFRVKMYSLSGQEISVEADRLNDESVAISFSQDLPAGLYLVRVGGDTYKIILE